MDDGKDQYESDKLCCSDTDAFEDEKFHSMKILGGSN